MAAAKTSYQCCVLARWTRRTFQLESITPLHQRAKRYPTAYQKLFS